MKLPDRIVVLYCFAPAGGSAEMFWRWQSLMPPGIRVRSVERPGRGERSGECPVTGYGMLSDLLAAEVASDIERERTTASRVEYAFFGLGEGATLAFSVCARVEQHLGQAACHGWLVDGLPPHLAAPGYADLSDEVLVGAMQTALADELPDLRSYFLPLLRADLRAHEGACIDRGVRINAPLTVMMPPEECERAALLRQWVVCSWHHVHFERDVSMDAIDVDGSRPLPLYIAEALRELMRAGAGQSVPGHRAEAAVL